MPPALVASSVLSLYLLNSDKYVAMMQEDGIVEWLTFLLFLAAGVAGLCTAIKQRRLFDLLVALFCLFVAGEEVSWGQRLLGYVPPDFFLANNFQQETNLHNFSGSFGRPKWVLATLLGAYGLLLPLVARSLPSTVDRVGATPPPLVLAPWFGACVLLLIWYPVEYTGEWVELLAATLFAGALVGWQALTLAGASIPVAIALVWLGVARSGTSSEKRACAQAETAALARDIVTVAGDRDELDGAASVEKRVWSAAEAGYIDWSGVTGFLASACAGEAASRTAARLRYGIDPWGNAYWLRTEEGEGSTITVYSFGENRRRDLEGGDDVRAADRWGSSPRN